jgi:hypothetical protein
MVGSMAIIVRMFQIIKTENQTRGKMIRKIVGISQVVIGIILVAIGGFFIIVLLTGGGPILPHIVGPITVAVIGTLLLVFRRRVK